MRSMRMSFHGVVLAFGVALGFGGVAFAVPTRPAAADPADWCGGHKLPESMCTQCNPSLIPAFQAAGDWCASHGFPESVCPLCHPLAPPGAPATAGSGQDRKSVV